MWKGRRKYSSIPEHLESLGSSEEAAAKSLSDAEHAVAAAEDDIRIATKDRLEGEAKRLIRIKATTRGGSRRRAARVSKVRANMRANTFSNRVSRQSKKGAGGQFFK